MKSLHPSIPLILLIILISACKPSQPKEKYLLQYTMPIDKTMRITTSSNVEVRTYRTTLNQENFTSDTYTNYEFKINSNKPDGSLEIGTQILNYNISLDEGGQTITYNSLTPEDKMDYIQNEMHIGIKPFLNKELVLKMAANGKIIDDLSMDGKPIPNNEIFDPFIMFPEFPEEPIAEGESWTTTNVTPSTNIKRKFSYVLQKVDSLYYYVRIKKMSAPKLRRLSKELKSSGLIIFNREDCSLEKLTLKLSVNKPKELYLNVDTRYEQIKNIPEPDID